MKLPFYKNSTFFKYFFSYIMILLVSLAGFSFILNFTLKSEYKKSIDAKNQTSVESLLSFIETQITGIRRADFSIQQNISIISSRYNGNSYSQIAAINELKKHIAGVPIINDVIYIDNLQNKVISATNSSDVDEDNLYLSLTNETITAPLNIIFPDDNKNCIKKLSGKTESIFLYIPVQASLNYNSAYSLNMTELTRLITASSSTSIKDIYLVDDEYNVIASNVNSEVLPFLSIIKESELDNFNINDDADVFVLKSLTDSIKIVGFSDTNVINDLVDLVFRKAYLILLAILVIGIIITFISMNITYSPLNRLLKRIGTTTGRSNGDIKCLEDTFFNTQIENHKLLDKVNNYRLAIQKSIFDSVAYGNEKDIDQALSQIDTFFDPHMENCIFVTKIKVKNSLSTDHVADYIKKVLPHNGSCILIEKMTSEAVYLINYPGSEEYKDKALQMVFEEINQDTGCKAAISSNSKNPIDLAALYEQAKISSLFWDNQAVVVYDEIKDKISDNGEISYPYKIFDKLSEELIQLDFDMAQSALTDLFKILDLKRNPEFFLRCILIDTLTLIINSMNKSNIKFERYNAIYFETLFLCRSSDYNEKGQEIIANIKQILDIYANEITNSSLHITQVKKFIEENYMSSDFSIAMLADNFGVSIAYMSFIFKKKTDINLSDYVWNIRMEKAKSLLLDTDMSIEEISGLVGYDNASSFRRKFKESLGITPSQIRKKP